MGLSLAQSTRKNRIGDDPRNTQWANDTSRFGHQQMLSMGWVPGKGLGYSVEGAKDHVKIQHKMDSKGLGYDLKQADQPTGLDVFQKILAKLNGNIEEVEEKQQHRARMTGLYMHFVPGGVLEGTVKSKEEMKRLKKEAIKRAERDSKHLEEMQTEKEKKEKNEKEKDEREKEKVKEKKDKVKQTKSKKDKKNKKDKKLKKKDKKDNIEKSFDKAAKKAVKEESNNEKKPLARGIRATRSRYIAMKRQATADSKGLKEILMQK